MPEDREGWWQVGLKAVVLVGVTIPFITMFAIKWADHMTRQIDNVTVQLAEMKVWIAATDANRFTMSDWNRERKALIQELPPRWVQEDLKTLKERTARNEAMLQDLRERVIQK